MHFTPFDPQFIPAEAAIRRASNPMRARCEVALLLRRLSWELKLMAPGMRSVPDPRAVHSSRRCLCRVEVRQLVQRAIEVQCGALFALLRIAVMSGLLDGRSLRLMREPVPVTSYSFAVSSDAAGPAGASAAWTRGDAETTAMVTSAMATATRTENGS